MKKYPHREEKSRDFFICRVFKTCLKGAWWPKLRFYESDSQSLRDFGSLNSSNGGNVYPARVFAISLVCSLILVFIFFFSVLAREKVGKRNSSQSAIAESVDGSLLFLHFL